MKRLLASCPLFVVVRAFVVVPAFVVTVLAACDAPPAPPSEGEGEGEGEGDACPISSDARGLLIETVDQLFANTVWTISSTSGGDFPDLAFGASLVGLEARVLQHASLAVPCNEPTTFAPTCETSLLPPGEPPPSPFFAEHDRCFRLGCGGDGTFFVDVYFVMQPNTLPDEPRHEFTFELDTIDGATAVYEENPYVRWNSDLAQDGVVDVSADIDVTHTVILADDTPVDVSHSGTVIAQHVTGAGGAGGDDDVSIDIALAFPNIAPGGAVVEVHALADGSVNGFVSVGVDGAVIATLDAQVNLDGALPFAFVGDCE